MADPGSVVCGEHAEGEIYCTAANADGAFDLVRGAISPSTVTDCLPLVGTVYLYQNDCMARGMMIDRAHREQQFGGPWLDIRCNKGCGPGYCLGDSFVDSCAAYAPDSNISIAMCTCDLLDPSCGLGTCVSNGAYCEGGYCAAPVCYAPGSPISQAMCGGVAIDPTTCTGDCTPHTTTFSAGVDDNFSGANGVESPSPSAALTNWVNTNYGIPGIRNFDEAHWNQYFAHTFSGLQPQNGATICGARLRTRIAHQHHNDSLGLYFFDAGGNQVIPGWGDSLTNLGVPLGGNALITIDIGALPGGAGFLTQMQNGGWLDILIQDDAMIDFMDLDVDYCCPCEPHTTTALSGVDDSFSTANGVESPTPSTGLISWVNSVYSNPGTRNYDESHADQYFAHTFTGLEPQNGAHICGARLRTRIDHNHHNDSLGLYFFDASGTQVGPAWGDSLTNLGVPLGGNALITIDIGTLPGGAAMLSQMQNGWLDILIQDDAMVDFMELEVDYCCPCEPYDTSSSAGVNDNFSTSNGTESPSPSPDLLTYIATVYWPAPGSRNFDDYQIDRWFGHTFTGLEPENGADICDATLTTAVANQHYNDSLALFFIDNTGTAVGASWGASLASLGVPAWSTGPISINIGSVPGGAAILAQMENGWLDFIVQDDTAVDHVTLRVHYCCRGTGTPSTGVPSTR
jgi:hypothetical protein